MHKRLYFPWTSIQAAAVLLAALLLAPGVKAQKPEVVGENLLRLEGVDRESGIRYVKFIVLLRQANTPADAAIGSLPRFTVECHEQAGKRSLHWLGRLDGSADFGFQRPTVAAADQLYPKQNPSAQLTMRFEGYKRSPEFKRQWEILPTGEFHYRRAGMGSSNVDDPVYFMTWLNSLPNLRIGLAKPTPQQPGSLIFPTALMLPLIRKAELCQP